METLRAYAAGNQGTIMNVVYLVAFLVALYYFYRFIMYGAGPETSLLDTEVDANKVKTLNLPKGLRVKTGGEYTLSYWMYINSWETRAGLAKSVLQIMDSGKPSHALLNTILYPNEPKMMIRVHTEGKPQGGTDYTNLSEFTNLMKGVNTPGMFESTVDMPMCDLQNIDLQRWINIVISVNGRIVDIYYDGKLARSCVLPDIPQASNTGAQTVVMGAGGGFDGKISGIQFFGYPVTPDRIYAIYQAGPRGAAGFLGYLADKLGLKLTYSGAGGEAQSIMF
jgi:hypothetical protein